MADNYDLGTFLTEEQNPPTMSPREALARRIAGWLRLNSDVLTAPYGVLEGLHTPSNGRGRARSITFGIARTLDAQLLIWSEKRMELTSSRVGPEAVIFKSEGDFYAYCVQEYGAKL
jgi:hypothetical protein